MLPQTIQGRIDDHISVGKTLPCAAMTQISALCIYLTLIFHIHAPK